VLSSFTSAIAGSFDCFRVQCPLQFVHGHLYLVGERIKLQMEIRVSLFGALP
jgi:hypothetical protein